VRSENDIGCEQDQYQLAPTVSGVFRDAPIDRGALVLCLGGAEKAIPLQMVFVFRGSGGRTGCVDRGGGRRRPFIPTDRGVQNRIEWKLQRTCVIARLSLCAKYGRRRCNG
jgi:hypothetical protein